MNTKYLNTIVTVKMDRPLGSVHPKHGYIYPVNYGYIPNTISGDGEELDAYVLGEHIPLEEFTGKVVAIIHRTNDNDDKLVVMKEGRNYTDEQIRALTEFQEQWFESIIIRWLKINNKTKFNKYGNNNLLNYNNKITFFLCFFHLFNFEFSTLKYYRKYCKHCVLQYFVFI